MLEQLKADRQLRDLPVIVTSSVEGWPTSCVASSSAPRTTCQAGEPVLLKARIGTSLEEAACAISKGTRAALRDLRQSAQDLAAVGLLAGGRRVHGSVMFSDIRGFTALVEACAGAEETIELLNTYYTLMFDAITGHGGVVNQMIGRQADGDLRRADRDRRPRAARRSAQPRRMIDMVERSQRRARRRGQGRDRDRHRHRHRRMIAGYTGTQERATYTCIGDTVNLAARLEAHTSWAQRAVLIDEGDAHRARWRGRRRGDRRVLLRAGHRRSGGDSPPPPDGPL